MAVADPITISLTTDEISLVQDSWAEATTPNAANGDEPATAIASILYAGLFSLHPELKELFHDINRQSASLGAVLGVAIGALGDIESITPALESLGKLHGRIPGVQPEHFDVVGNILIATFSDKFGEKWTPELQAPWVKVYAYVSGRIVASMLAVREANV
ncbi:globin-like protein [Lipomyces doorenjongii]|uniref:globin-like protein n=1 Tax=Lipomyces doorenjongii TaxID=383834 RepID=UPI0033431EC8